MRVMIFYYSGTDNTRKGVQILQEALRRNGHQCEVRSVEDGFEADSLDCDLLGFASPVYHGYPAKRMLAFLQSLPRFERPVLAFTALSCCFRPLDIGVWGAREHFRERVEDRNAIVIDQLRFFAEASHPYIRKVFLNDWTAPHFAAMFGVGCPDHREQRRIRLFADDLEVAYENHQRGRRKELEHSSVRKWLSTYVVRAFVETMDRTLLSKSVDEERCEGCGACIRKCPSEALAWRGGYPAYDRGKCDHCQKCINLCPAHATIYLCSRNLNRYSPGKRARNP